MVSNTDTRPTGGDRCDFVHWYVILTMFFLLCVEVDFTRAPYIGASDRPTVGRSVIDLSQQLLQDIH